MSPASQTTIVVVSIRLSTDTSAASTLTVAELCSGPILVPVSGSNAFATAVLVSVTYMATGSDLKTVVSAAAMMPPFGWMVSSIFASSSVTWVSGTSPAFSMAKQYSTESP